MAASDLAIVYMNFKGLQIPSNHAFPSLPTPNPDPDLRIGGLLPGVGLIGLQLLVEKLSIGLQVTVGHKLEDLVELVPVLLELPDVEVELGHSQRESEVELINTALLVDALVEYVGIK